jgi:uncharacterized protein YodC (DUF2158 family)
MHVVLKKAAKKRRPPLYYLMETINIGDVVRLRSARLQMTVAAVSPEGVQCVWLSDDGQLRMGCVPASAIEASRAHPMHRLTCPSCGHNRMTCPKCKREFTQGGVPIVSGPPAAVGRPISAGLRLEAVAE